MENGEKIENISFVSLESEENIKHIRVDLLHKRSNPKKRMKCQGILPKEARERIMVGTEEWQFTESDYSLDMQLYYLNILYTEEFLSEPGSTINSSIIPETENEMCKNKISILKKIIGLKRQGYKQQDVEKEIYNEDKFISLEQIIKLLVKSRLCCFYCREGVSLYYRMVRDPKQWSLERIYNQYGHNYDNVEIACLTCNIRRSTMHHERYIKTKNMQIVVKFDGERSEPS